MGETKPPNFRSKAARDFLDQTKEVLDHINDALDEEHACPTNDRSNKKTSRPSMRSFGVPHADGRS